MAVKKYLDLVGLQNYNQTVLVDTIGSLLSYDSTNSKFVSTSFSRGEGANAGKVVKGSATDVIAVTTEVTENSGALVTSGGVYSAIQGITEPMIFKGGVTLTADSTDTTKCSLTITDPASAANIKKGFTYKVTTIASTPTYTGTIKVGDTLIAAKNGPDVTATWVENTDWTIVPSGDEPSGTVTSVGVESSGDGAAAITVSGTPVTSSGTITLTVNAATDSAFGVVKTGTNITNTSGVISVADATTTGKGVVQIGTNIDVSEGIISVATGSDSVKGVLQVGDNLSVASGVVSVATADASTLGVVKPDGTTIVNGTEGDPAVTTGVISVNIDGESVQSGADGLYVDTITYEGAGNDISALFA